jgi:hypothetical protein
MASQVKAFSFLVGGETLETIIYAFSIDQAKRLLRNALQVARLPKGTIIQSSSPTDCPPDIDMTELDTERKEVKDQKAARKEHKLSGRLTTVFVFKLKDGREIEIQETAQTRAKVLLRELLKVARLPSGITCEKVEKVLDIQLAA